MSETKPTVSRNAVVSVIVGAGSIFVGIALIGWIGGIVAVLLGHTARYEIRHNPDLSGKGLATTGLVLGYCGLGFQCLVFVAALIGSVVNTVLLLFAVIIILLLVARVFSQIDHIGNANKHFLDR